MALTTLRKKKKKRKRKSPSMPKMSLLFVSVLLVTFVSPSLCYNNGINWWCSKTPFPNTCRNFMRHAHLPKEKSQFKKTTVHIALEQSFKAQSHNKWLGSKCRNDKEKAAWTDCLSLYQETITLLNQTLDPTIKRTDYDVQTWLSSALTNLETCRAGFADLNIVSGYVLPLIMSNNVSELISNALALQNGSIPPKAERDGFPRWVSGGDRKLLQSSSPAADLVVAQDGSGDYKTIAEGLKAVADRSGMERRFVIHVKTGVYKENLKIGSKWKNIMLIGDGLRLTVITGSRSVGGGSTTFNSATVAVTAEGFIARGITFRNTAGRQKHQAVALRSGADYSVFYRCSFEGYQDTLYAHSQRQFYKECYIYGTVDFIFGNAAVVLQNCMIYARKPMIGQKNTVTAQGRTDPNQNTGIVIHSSRVTAAPDLVPRLSSVKTYLGRPWKMYSRTVFLRSFLDTLVDPAGWLEWDGDFAVNSLYYGEYNNFGPGSSTSQRVRWRGYHVITNASVASRFTVQNFIEGESWLLSTGVPFFPTI